MLRPVISVMIATLFCPVLNLAAAPKTMPYYVMKDKACQKAFFLGEVEQGRSITMGFSMDCQIKYVIPVNTHVYGRVFNTSGQEVIKGRTLAKASSKIQELSLNVAMLNLKKTQLTVKDMEEDFQRVKSLFERSVYSTKQFQDATNEFLKAKTDYEVAKMQVYEAREDLEKCYLRAPFDGVVEKNFVSEGSSVESGDPVLKLCILSPARVIVKMHEVLTGLISVNNRFLVYPSGNFSPSAAWLSPRGIFPDHIVLFVDNNLIAKTDLSPEDVNLPKVQYMSPAAKLRKMPGVQIWVPDQALVYSKGKTYVWVAEDEFAIQKEKAFKRVFTVRKIEVEIADMIMERSVIPYHALKKANGIKPFQLIVVESDGNLVDGKKAVLEEYRRKFRPGEKVWVLIPELTKLVHSVPMSAIQKRDDNFYLFTVSNNKAVPIEVFIYEQEDSSAWVIGAGLKYGLKVLLPQKGDLIFPGDEIKLDREIPFHP
ncbi:hypothetical protein P0136_03610 [Lentisphaerota bacterium ZTH]|nr:hypothetical protein JYG24_05265 [Lentisphaerota bacterium]WET07087.1 hypothetical protein P0136_03610 [Lentisphaerota bacterium ZTH]